MIKWAIELSEYNISYQPRSAIKTQALAEFMNEATFTKEDEGMVVTCRWFLHTCWQWSWSGAHQPKGMNSNMLYDLTSRPRTMRSNMKLSLQVETDWRKPLLDNLIEGILSADEIEAARLKSRAARFVLLAGLENSRLVCQARHPIMIHVCVAFSQANGQVEVTNRILVQGIKAKIAQVGGQWVDALPAVLWSYRTTPHSTTEKPLST
ncbi:UNVERIFIED_CONTAM: hypothetical protein Slati_1363700 [Sesamum latifolium]|uniref:Uncharacterized protein n=1 Tax=Sesamum latifolium TaxID=2727402 RepID=A0AAW2XMC8_9LAMI